MRVGILTVQVPFVRGGAESHAINLRDALEKEGVEAEIIAIPFKWYPPEAIAEQLVATRLIDIEESCGRPIDRVIGLKFPSYLLPHRNKVLWILHQHRSAYDLWKHPYGDLHHYHNGEEIAGLIKKADCSLIPEARRVYANSRNVTDRLRRFCGLDSTPLYHPPPAFDRYSLLENGDFFLVPGRINTLKRQYLVAEALRRPGRMVKVVFIGRADEAEYAETFRSLLEELPAGSAEWRGEVSLEEKIRLFGSCLGVVVPAFDEDYGYVTLEAMLSSKPVITFTDSGGPLEFVVRDETGIVSAPGADELRRAMDLLQSNRPLARRMGRAGREAYDRLQLSWSNVVETLLR